jgi:hypothetical protein
MKNTLNLPLRHSICLKPGRVVLALTIIALILPNAFAQRDAGGIAGTVADASGAAVPNAKVIVTEEDKKISYNTTTSSSGEFSVSPLAVGRYSVRVQKAGFSEAVAGPFTLDVQQRVAINVSLRVGEVSEKVDVTDIAEQLDTLTSDLGQVVNSREMVDLPLNGRNFAQLALLSVGVNPGEPGGRATATYGFSSNGARSYQNNFMLDGIDNNSSLTDLFNGTSYVVQPSVDALQEFRVQTNAYSAEFSRGTGSVVNATIKSGSNGFHGDLYEFFRNDKMDAINYFATTKPEYRQNQFGATFGGPVVIPHVYDGHDKTFFFVDYAGLRSRQGLTLTGYVPTVAERSGDFSSLIDYSSPVTGVLDCNGNPTYAGEIFNTRLTQTSTSSPTGLCGVPFGYSKSGLPSNVIPASLIDPASAKVAALWGAPNVNGPGYNYISEPVQSTDQNNFDGRVDHRFTDQDNMFVRYSFEQQPSTIPTIFQNTGGYGVNFYAGLQKFTYHNLGASETHIFQPTLVNEFRFGFNHIDAHRYPWGYQQDLSAELGIPGVPYGPLNGGLPEFDYSGYTGVGDHSDLPTVETQRTFEVSDTMTWVKGRHTVKFGADVLPELITISQPNAARGDFGYGPQFSDNPAAPGTGGNSIATFLVGLPSYTQITNIINIQYQRLINGYFFQDDYRVNNRLTLNLGLRWDYFGNITEQNNHQANVLIGTGTIVVPTGTTEQLPASLAAIFKYSATASAGLVPQRYNAWAPRVGLAYRLTKLLVFRAGYGLFYTGYENGPWSNPSPGYNPPFYASQSFNTTCGGAAASTAANGLNCVNPATPTLSVGIPANALTNPNSPSLTELDPHMETPYLQQFHATFQYQLPSETLLEVGYAGSRGTHLYEWFNGNQATPTSDPTAASAPRRPFPGVDGGINVLSTQGFSKYNSLQARLEKRFSHGLSALVSYSWQHALDNGSSANLGSSNNSGLRYFRADPSLDYGNADFDIRQRFVTSYTYDLPIGHGRALGTSLPGWANLVAGGWRNSTILTLQTGNWYTVEDGNANFANSDGSQNPNLIGNPNGKACVNGTSFNTCAFTDPPLGSLGNAGKNIVQEPGSVYFDTSLMKDFLASESKRFEFRAEFFNILNHPNLSSTNLSFGSGSFGFPNNASAPRQIQFALKFYF